MLEAKLLIITASIVIATVVSASPPPGDPTENKAYWKAAKDQFTSAYEIPILRQAKIEDFNPKQLVGRGTFGEASLVEYRSALYVMKKPLKGREISDSEIKIMNAVDHPFLMNLKYCVKDNRTTYLVTEYCPGGDLHTQLDKSNFSEEEAQFCASQLILALEYLHNVGVIHRDLKPRNIVLDSKGHLKIIDFGLARFLDRKLEASSFVGTADFVAPELLRGFGYGKAVDYWALGVTLYVLVAGKSPFYHEDQDRLLRNVLYSPLKFLDDVNLKISKEFRRFLKYLIRRNVGTRFNVKKMKRDPWFKNVNWDDVYNTNVPVPPRFIMV